MLNFHLTPALISHISLKAIRMKPLDAEISPQCLKAREGLRLLARCLQINHVEIQKTEARCYFYPTEDCWGNHYLSCFDIYTLPDNYFPVMAGANLSFSIWPERC